MDENPVKIVALGVSYQQALAAINKYNKHRELPATTYAISMEHGIVDPESCPK